MSLDVILSEMARHTEENPTHGHNCSCKDKWLREARWWYRRLDENEQREFRYIAHALDCGCDC